ncbi:hypothetical protein H6P81_017263 [Aristolochia fimbriata]|uniref:Protein kinase domain-containing protein n=1 Tax=Aristolochia fimbriata TaxID=158543 RepID=A0AAV7DXZ4_ARIFI|nr:hypothetical protein H6P81_017263 [Aristolochia fimbriata]
MRASSMPLSGKEIYQGCRTPSINSKFSASPGSPDLGPSSSAREFYQGFPSSSESSGFSLTSTGTEDDDGDREQPSLIEPRKKIGKIFRFRFTNSAVQRRRYRRADIERITGHFRRPINNGETPEKVYYGKLADGTDVAVKVLSSELWHSSTYFNQFKLMIEQYMDLEHKNLLRIIGYYFGKSFSALIMEYMPGGDLTILSGVPFFFSLPLPPGKTNEDFSRLFKLFTSIESLDHKLPTWAQQIQIALDVAQGLEYLHCSPPVIHGNVKLANILLDKNLIAKLAEPRYMVPSHFDKQRDVHDFGTVLWFLITGLSPSILKTTYLTADDMDRSWELPSLSLDTDDPSLQFDSNDARVPDVLIDTALKFSDSLWRLAGMSTSTFQPSTHGELPRGLFDSVCLGIKIAGACAFAGEPAMTLVVHALKVCLKLANQEAPSLAEASSQGSINT